MRSTLARFLPNSLMKRSTSPSKSPNSEAKAAGKEAKRKLTQAETDRSLRDLATHPGWPQLEAALLQTWAEYQVPPLEDSPNWSKSVAHALGGQQALDKFRTRIASAVMRANKRDKKLAQQA